MLDGAQAPRYWTFGSVAFFLLRCQVDPILMGVFCMVNVSKGAKSMVGLAESNLEVGKMPAWLVNLHLGIDWPMSCQSYLTQGGVPLK